jgi:hypothetical protein
LINKSSPGLKKQDWLLENLTHLQQALHFKTSSQTRLVRGGSCLQARTMNQMYISQALHRLLFISVLVYAGLTRITVAAENTALICEQLHVRNQRGKPLKDLTQSDFVVLENGIERPIRKMVQNRRMVWRREI